MIIEYDILLGEKFKVYAEGTLKSSKTFMIFNKKPTDMKIGQALCDDKYVFSFDSKGGDFWIGFNPKIISKLSIKEFKYENPEYFL